MGAPITRILEKDESIYQPLTRGLRGGIVIAATKGTIGTAELIDSEKTLLKKYTPNGKLEVGMDLGFFSAITFLSTGPCWVARAANGALYGGMVVASRDSDQLTSAFSSGVEDIEDYAFPGGPSDSNYAFALYGIDQGDYNNNIGVLIYNYHANDDIAYSDVDFEANTITTHIDLDSEDSIYSQGAPWCAGEAVKFALKSQSDVLPYPLVANRTYYVIEAGDNKIKLATTLANALAAQPVPIDLLSSGSVVATSYTLMPATQKCKTPGCFTVEVYYRSSSISSFALKESLTASLLHIKDGNGVNVFIEDSLESSEYVKALINENIIPIDPVTAYPKAVTGVVSGTSIIPFAFDEGDNGDALVDGDYISALDALSNPDDVPLHLVMDGGKASPAYQQALYEMCEARKDCFAVLSVPYVNEASSNYLDSIINYRKIDTNFDTSYAAMYTPHRKIYDKDNDRSIYVSPDGAAAAVINISGWLPPFGLRRGKVTALGLRRNYTQAEMDLLADNCVNSIKYVPGKGYYVWGDWTLSAIPSALDGINVRLALTTIQPDIKNLCDTFIGELVNDVTTRDSLKIKIESYLTRAKANKIVNDFYVVCDASNNTIADQEAHTLNVEVYFKPFLSIRYINFTTIITGQGTTFSQAQ